MEVTWKEIGNVSLAQEIRREGEDASGDPAVRDTDDPKYWGKVAVIGVPVREVGNEPVLNVVSVAKDAGDKDGTRVLYAGVRHEDLFRTTATDVNGQQVDVFAARVRIGGSDATVGFVSGDIDATPLEQGPSWAAESTRPIDMNTSVRNPEYANYPLV
jgi:hypothetical protein